jgi:hypothetical protein
MIYNLAQYLRDNLAGLVIVVNGFSQDTVADANCLNLGSGFEQPWFDRQDTLVTVYSRAISGPTAYYQNNKIYDLIKKRYGIILPAITVDGVIYPEVKTWAIRPVNRPQYAYDDDEKRPTYMFSVDITTTI